MPMLIPPFFESAAINVANLLRHQLLDPGSKRQNPRAPWELHSEEDSLACTTGSGIEVADENSIEATAGLWSNDMKQR